MLKPLVFRLDDLSGEPVRGLIGQHLAGMHANSPAGSVHALDLDELRRPEVTFWSMLDGDELMGCGALKRLDATHGELKSMRTAPARRRSGVGRTLLTHIIDEARRMGFRQLSLETGSAEFFQPARNLYARFGFTVCGPFAEYTLDPHSVYMTRTL